MFEKTFDQPIRLREYDVKVGDLILVSCQRDYNNCCPGCLEYKRVIEVYRNSDSRVSGVTLESEEFSAVCTGYDFDSYLFGIKSIAIAQEDYSIFK